MLVVRMSDNTIVVPYLKKQGVTVSMVMCSCAQIMPWSEVHFVMLFCEIHLWKKNVMVDQLSRQDQVLFMEWSLLPWV